MRLKGSSAKRWQFIPGGGGGGGGGLTDIVLLTWVLIGFQHCFKAGNGSRSGKLLLIENQF